jgi:uncharacterized protein YjiS (DUF1127 family)
MRSDDQPAFGGLGPAARPGSLPAVLGTYLVKLWQSNRERQRLAELDPRLLRDIGIDPVAAAHEVERPFWQLSAHHEGELRKQARVLSQEVPGVARLVRRCRLG